MSKWLKFLVFPYLHLENGVSRSQKRLIILDSSMKPTQQVIYSLITLHSKVSGPDLLCKDTKFKLNTMYSQKWDSERRSSYEWERYMQDTAAIRNRTRQEWFNFNDAMSFNPAIKGKSGRIFSNLST